MNKKWGRSPSCLCWCRESEKFGTDSKIPALNGDYTNHCNKFKKKKINRFQVVIRKKAVKYYYDEKELSKCK